MIKSPDDVIDYFDGMLTREQAAAIYSKYENVNLDYGMPFDAHGMAMLLDSNSNGILEGFNAGKVDISDKVYRVLNPVIKKFGEKTTFSRTIVLGKEGDTVMVTLSKKSSRLLGKLNISRDDKVTIKSLKIDFRTGTLKSTMNTVIERLEQSNTCISRLSRLKPGIRGVDIIGKLIEVGPEKRLPKSQGGAASNAVLAKISDSTTALAVSCVGYPASCIKRMPLNSTIRVEFCSIIERNGSIIAYADANSRIMSIK